ncbi:phage tail protein, P2 protein I family [Aliiroseovarius crassostreae]|uniref:Phage tail protein n=1 Tax=Aliiroseovarius crassostreae TaxID=154981 RepID=A0A0N8IBW6_9RHOB|nr:phage tail protein I [Aliiroseovarius crassostreae]KPN64251.1 hypothetical protein AKJ29_16585 [Aliiroseovarius crassostreae]SFU30956.1 phage tail protein, P2 protein I family [Aliiroseovarius crassostreae]
MPFDQSAISKSSTRFERAMERCVRAVFDFPTVLETLWNADTCPVEALPFLAHAYSANFFDPQWPEDLQRAMLRNSRELHLWMGTRKGLKLALKYAGYGDAVVVEGKSALVGADWVVAGPEQSVGGPQSWNEFWVIVRQEITPDQLRYLAGIIEAVAPLFCDLTRVMVDRVNYAVGEPWSVGTETVWVGSTFNIGDLNA